MIIEGDMTFSGKPKPFYFRDNKERFAKYAGKIYWLPVALSRENIDFPTDFSSSITDGYSPNSPTALMERIQRNSVLSVLKRWNPWDIVLTGDLDEIPSKDSLKEMVKLYNQIEIADNASYTFSQICFYYNFNQCMRKLWSGTVIARNLMVQNETPQKLRNNRFNKQHIRYGGWHLSYFMTPEKIIEKLKSFVHQEYNKEPYINLEYIKNKIFLGEDLFDKEVFLKFDRGDINLSPEVVECFNGYV